MLSSVLFQMIEFSKEIGGISNKIFNNIKKLNYTHSFCCHFSLFILYFSKLVRVALPLKKKNFFQSNLIINIKTKNDKFYECLKNPYLEIFKGSKKLIVEEINLEDKKSPIDGEIYISIDDVLDNAVKYKQSFNSEKESTTRHPDEESLFLLQ